MGVLTYIEPLVLYALLFLRIPQRQEAAALAFSPAAELARILLYNIPALVLVWHLLFKVKSPGEWGVGLPRRRDILPAALALGGLALIGFAVSLAPRYFQAVPPAARFPPPETVPSWALLVVSCLSTGYLEESFFRFYLLSRRKAMGLSPSTAALISVLLFSFCHIYEGPWGFLNSALSGTLLCFIFLRYRSLHGVALAHGLYNILVYALNGIAE